MKLSQLFTFSGACLPGKFQLSLGQPPFRSVLGASVTSQLPSPSSQTGHVDGQLVAPEWRLEF